MILPASYLNSLPPKKDFLTELVNPKFLYNTFLKDIGNQTPKHWRKNRIFWHKMNQWCGGEGSERAPTTSGKLVCDKYGYSSQLEKDRLLSSFTVISVL